MRRGSDNVCLVNASQGDTVNLVGAGNQQQSTLQLLQEEVSSQATPWPAYTSRKLNVPSHESYSFCVNRAEVTTAWVSSGRRIRAKGPTHPQTGVLGKLLQLLAKLVKLSSATSGLRLLDRSNLFACRVRFLEPTHDVRGQIRDTIRDYAPLERRGVSAATSLCSSDTFLSLEELQYLGETVASSWAVALRARRDCLSARTLNIEHRAHLLAPLVSAADVHPYSYALWLLTSLPGLGDLSRSRGPCVSNSTLSVQPEPCRLRV